jgi:hypothetical protein
LSTESVMCWMPRKFSMKKAGESSDQREMTEFERSGERMALLGHSGGRFPRGAARPGLAWASDIIDAIKRKETKVIFKSSLTPRHLIIYPNSNASKLLGDQLGQEGKNEREAIGHLRQAIDNAGNLARVTNGCHVHVLGMRHICVDVVGDMKVTDEQRRARLRADARGRDGGVRKELATQAVYPLTHDIDCSRRAVV